MGQVSGTCNGGSKVRGPLSQVAVGNCLGVVGGWIRRSVSEATWMAYSKVWWEWSEVLCLAGVEQGDSAVRLVSKNMEKGVSVSALERKLAGYRVGWILQRISGFGRR